ncbi:MAG: site-2 protease family protein [Ruminococcus sp.]|nr:site-2 protease family protein [Ruminococcus sp.]
MNFLSSIFNISDPYTILARIAIILLILPLHEFAHGWMAKHCGDDTAEAAGRLTFNPFAHVDPFGAVLLLLTGFGWAKPVPINPARMNHPRSGVVWTSLAGPISNLIAALVGMICLQIVWPFYWTYGTGILLGIYDFFLSFVTINIGLALFNLIPIPPLDGSKVLISLLPYRQSNWLQRNSQWLSIILLLLVFLGALSTPLSWLSTKILDLFIYATNWIDKLVWMVIE